MLGRRGRRDFRGRVVVITGAAGGIGRALGARFAAAGARLALLDRDEPSLEQASGELRARGADARALVCDVTDAARCRAVMDEIAAGLGSIDVLVANAGAVHRSGFIETDLDVFRRVMEVNFFGALHSAKAALPRLLEARGLIIVTSSIAGLAPLYGRSGYAASKHALHGLFESVRAELRPTGVEVLMVCPSFTRTGFEQAALGADGRPVERARSQVGRLASPEAVAAAVYRGAVARRRILVLSTVGKISYVLTRLAPSLYERLMIRSLARELRP